MLPLGLSLVLLKRQNEVWTAFRALVFLITLSYVALSRIPLNKHETHPRIGKGVEGEITAAKRRTKRKGNDSSFTFNIHDGICHLWLYSFEDLSTNLSSSLGKKLG